MPFQPFEFTAISPGVFVYAGAVNTGVLQAGDRAVLIDCDDTLTPARLAELGIRQVERIYCTQHRRPNTAGIPAFSAAVYAPLGESRLLSEGAATWRSWHNRWHLYHSRPGPQAPLRDIDLAGTVQEGDRLEWGGFRLGVLATPGMTDGAVSYVVEPPGASPQPRAVVFCGDVLYGPGQVWDVHALQKNAGEFSDYHGFLGAARTLIASLGKLGETGAAGLVPSHCDPRAGMITDPAGAARAVIQRLEALLRNYAAISALNFYFPDMLGYLADDPARMAPCAQLDFPDFIVPVAATSFAIRSETGALFLVDCGQDAVLDTLNAWQAQGRFTRLEGCWVTHYHDDHVDALHHLASARRTPIHADEHFAEVLEHPARFYLPCISPAAAPVGHVTTHGQTWRWHEFELTALHLPGQSFYNGGLLLRGHGLTVLFGGDSFAPTGLDDYNAGNRNLLGAGQGYRRCIELLRAYRPDLILNQHQGKAFHFSDTQLDYMDGMLADREALLADLLPWAHPNYGIDEGWIRAYPYQVDACAGSSCRIEVRAANHAGAPGDLAVSAALPDGWEQPGQPAPGWTSRQNSAEWLTHAAVTINVPAGTAPGIYPAAFRVTWNGRYLGQVCHALIQVC